MRAKKRIITVGIVLVVTGLVIWGILALLEFLSLKTITFSLSSHTTSITIYDSSYGSDEPDNTPEGEENPRQIAYREGSGTLRLKPGTYYVIPSGDTIAGDSMKISITSDTTEVKIDPYYSEDYLAQSFTSELPAINTAIEQKYKNSIDQYTVKPGTFYHFGNWYSTTLHKNSAEQGEGIDVYGTILRKENGVWNIAASPQIIFTYKAYEHIPADVIYATNRAINLSL